MSALNISDLSYLNELEDIEQLQKGGFWRSFELDNDANFKIRPKGDVNQVIIANAQGNNVNGDQTVIAVAQGNLAVGGLRGKLDNDFRFY